MGDGRRLTDRPSREEFAVQVVGPSVGRCENVLGGVARFLSGRGFDVHRVGVETTETAADQLVAADAACFLFLHPEQAPAIDSARRLNEGVVRTLDTWILEHRDTLDATGLYYEERDTPLSTDGADAVGQVVGELIDAKPDPVAQRYAEVASDDANGVEAYVRPSDHDDHIDTLREWVARHCDDFLTET